jgi:hypothetical protein
VLLHIGHGLHIPSIQDPAVHRRLAALVQDSARQVRRLGLTLRLSATEGWDQQALGMRAALAEARHRGWYFPANVFLSKLKVIT